MKKQILGVLVGMLIMGVLWVIFTPTHSGQRSPSWELYKKAYFLGYRNAVANPQNDRAFHRQWKADSASVFSTNYQYTHE
jgi:hypothetical protein